MQYIRYKYILRDQKEKKTNMIARKDAEAWNRGFYLWNWRGWSHEYSPSQNFNTTGLIFLIGQSHQLSLCACSVFVLFFNSLLCSSAKITTIYNYLAVVHPNKSLQTFWVASQKTLSLPSFSLTSFSRTPIPDQVLELVRR